jgi:hypothetical protein
MVAVTDAEAAVTFPDPAASPSPEQGAEQLQDD